MFRRIMLTALVAGALAGLFAAGLQSLKITPLILEAEVYEQAAEAHGHPGVAHEHAQHDDAALANAAIAETAQAEEWEPAPGAERIAYTVLADVLAGIGFALLLGGAMALSGRKTGVGAGVLWGLAGFASFTLAPSLGLPPELPGMVAGELVARQAWWVLTAAATAGGLALIMFSRITWPKVVGVALIVLPHAIGAPHGGVGGVVPPELMAQFAAASIVTAGLFWVVLGGLSALVYQRLAR